MTLNGEDAAAVIATSSGAVVKTIATGRAPAHRPADGPMVDRIYVTSEGDMKVVAIDTAKWEVAAQIPVLAFPRVLAVTNDGRRLYQTIRWLNGALVLDTAKNQVVDRIALGEPKFAVEGKDAHGLAVTPDGKELWLTTQTNDLVTVLSVDGHKVLTRLRLRPTRCKEDGSGRAYDGSMLRHPQLNRKAVG